MSPSMLLRRFIPSFSFLALIAAGSASAQAEENTIDNFRVEERSDDSLRIIVDYFYSGSHGDREVFIHASPTTAEGSSDPRLVTFQERPLKLDSNTVTMDIVKKPDTKAFTSASIRVCMSTLSGAILCRDFHHAKEWPGSAAQPPSATAEPESADAAPPGPAGTCSYSGTISGRQEWKVPDGHGQTYVFRLDQVFLRVKGSDSVLNRARVRQTGAKLQYTFMNLKPGVTYTVFPGGAFSTDPPSRTFTCNPKPNTNTHDHRGGFKILGVRYED